MSSRLTALALAALAVLAVPTSALAQERSWTVSVDGGAGFFVPLRTLGKSAATELALGSTIAELKTALQVGAGVTIHFPETGFSVRGRYDYVPSGDVEGRLGICGDPDQPLLDGPLCDPIITEYSSQSVGAELRFLRGSTASTIRPVLSLGVGARGYSMEERAEQCGAQPGAEWEDVCERTVDIWRDDGSWSPFLRFGLGFQGSIGPLNITGDVQDIWGRYNGGTNRADGNTQNDITVMFSGSLRVF